MTHEPLFTRPQAAAIALLFALLALALPAHAETRATGRAAFDRMIVIEPLPERPTVKAIEIDWCELVTIEHPSGGALARKLTQMEDRGWYWQHIPQVAALLCGAPRDPDYKKQASYFIQGLVNLTGQSPKVVISDLKARLAQKTWDAQRAETCERFAVSDEASREDKDLAAAHRESFGCGRDPEPAWWLNKASIKIGGHLDRTMAPPSQVLRSYQVMSCLSTARGDAFEAVAYAMCRPDIDALDEKTLEAELSAAKHNRYARIVARQQLRFAALKGAALAAKAKKLAKKNAGYKTLIFEAPAVALAEWKKQSLANKTALEAAAAYESRFFGPSRKAARGCSDELRGHFRSFVKAAKPKTLEAAKAMATSAVGVLLLARLAACEAVEGNSHAAAMLYSLAKEGRASRGPRAAILNGLIDALNDIRADRPRFPVDFNALGRPSGMAILDETYRLASAGVTAMQKSSGAVKKTRKADGGIVVDFATVKWVEDNWHCKDTRKVWKIESNGRVLYHKSCKKVGKRTVKRTPKSIWVPASYAAKIKKGAFLEFDYDVKRRAGVFMGSVRTVYKSVKRKRLLAAYGVAL